MVAVHSCSLGLNELRIGKIIEDQPRAGRPKTKGKNPQLANDICDLVEQNSQTDPNFQSLFKEHPHDGEGRASSAA